MRKYSSTEKDKFEEERVRLMLTYLYPKRYSEGVLSESPDIVCKDNSIGVEVTSCRKKDRREKDSLVGPYFTKKNREVKHQISEV